MFKGSLIKDYARRFCEEYPCSKIVTRKESFPFIDSAGNEHSIVNGEYMFGPWQTWPAQIDDFALDVSDAHAHRKIDYITLKEIILLDTEVISRDYTSKKEYEYTIEQCFMAAKAGVINGKLRTAIKRKTQQTKEEMSWFQRLFSSEETIRGKVLQEPLVKKLIENFKEAVPSYLYGVRNYGLG
ncbi:MAG: hypothetical protein WC781_04550 [Candidatus Pacearchaeota archaeon]|jgi:hypothetical protein